ncbi:MAG: NADH-quinone oxidoreductase subunit N [Oligoflexales bacterium]
MIPKIPFEFFPAATPIFILSVGGLVAMMQSVYPKIGGHGLVKTVFFASLLGALVTSFLTPVDMSLAFFEGSFLSEALAKFGSVVLIAISIIIGMFYACTYQKEHFFRGEISSLFLLTLIGALVLVASDEIVSLFVGLEMASIGLYALAGYVKVNRLSMEGAIKYFVLGSFATGFLLFGLGLLVAGTGSMRVSEMIQLATNLADHPWIKLGSLFVLVGIGFKLALAPFHLWGPDTYEGASTGLTGFMATAVKTMMIILTLRFFAYGQFTVKELWMNGLVFLAATSLLLGNIMALVQSSVKRMLAYSSISHSGYMAIAVVAINATSSQMPVAAILFYLVGYTLVSLGAFGCLMWLENQNAENLQLEDFSGLAKKHPYVCATLSVFLLAFAGFPPTVGFISKFFVFSAALRSNLHGLVITGVVGSMIAMFYYLRLIVKMYMTEPTNLTGALVAPKSYFMSALLAGLVVLVILLGTVLPSPFFSVVQQAAESISVTH